MVTGRLVWDDEHHEFVVEAIRSAKVSVWIATANLKDVHVPYRGRRRYGSLLQDLDRLAREGVELRILHASLPSRSFRDSFDRFPRLVAGALALRQCPRVHLKTVVVDGGLLYLGSANLTGAGMGYKSPTRRNFEVGFVTRCEVAIDSAQARFDRIWRGRECSGCGRRAECEAPLDLAFSAQKRDKTVIAIARPTAAPRRVKRR